MKKLPTAKERFSSLKKRLSSNVTSKTTKVSGWGKGNNGRILFIDIETSPLLGYAWGVYEQNILKILKDWYLLSFAYRWADDDRVYVKGLPDYPLFKKDKEDDSELCRDLWKLLDEADIVIGHNGDNFDIKKSNARFIKHKFSPPSFYKSIDTLKIAKRYFKFSSNKLTEIGSYLGIGEKLPHTGLHLWLSCMDGDPKSWKLMKDYNVKDVQLLIDVYVQLMTWHTTHPDISLYSGSMGVCPKCESSNIIKRGFKFSATTKRQQFKCLDCSGWFSAGPPIKKVDPTLALQGN